MENVTSALAYVRSFLNFSLFKLGDITVTLWSVLYVLLLILLLFFVTSRLKKWMVTRLLKKGYVNPGIRESVASLVRYLLLLIGLIVIFQTAGIDLSSFAVVAGALGIGIGFGLQKIVGNMVSGIVILLERPIKVGDRIQVGTVQGDVIKISLRSTIILTNDNINVIVPNLEFTSSQVINWSYMDRDVRLHVPVGVAYGSNPEMVKQALLEVAAGNKGVVESPKPDVLLDSFGESSLNFVLRVWTREYTDRPGVLRSQLNFEILKTFASAGIRIPFPQRDIHVKSGPKDLAK